MTPDKFTQDQMAEAAGKIAHILREFQVGPEYKGDQTGKDRFVRQILDISLKILQVDGLGGCPLCGN